MFIKSLTVGLIACLATAGADQSGLKLFARWDEHRTASPFELPQTCTGAVSNGGKEIPSDLTGGFHLYAFNQIFSLYYSKDCTAVAGIRIAIPCSNKLPKESGIDYDNFPGLSRHTQGDTCVYAAKVLFRDASDTGNTLFRILDTTGTHEIPNNEYTLSAIRQYQKMNCLDRMGELWYRPRPKGSGCTKLYPWSVLIQSGRVTGLGFQLFGKADSDQFSDSISPQIVKYGMKGPGCIVTYAKKYGLISLHLWISKNPANFKCKK